MVGETKHFVYKTVNTLFCINTPYKNKVLSCRAVCRTLQSITLHTTLFIKCYIPHSTTSMECGTTKCSVPVDTTLRSVSVALRPEVSVVRSVVSSRSAALF